MIIKGDKEKGLEQAAKLRQALSDALVAVLAAELHLDLGDSRELFMQAHRELVAKTHEAEAEITGTPVA